MNIPIIYEDDNVVVIDKPAGVIVHRGGEGESNREQYLTDWLLQKYPDIANVGEDALRPGIVHRLDKDTSGVMIVAKTQSAHEFLKDQFKKGEAKKTYRAIAVGEIAEDRGVIDRPIGKEKGNIKMRKAGSFAHGKLRNAVTYFKVMKRTCGYSYIELYPKTGRTHQIRVHLKSIGHPIVCDPVYGKRGFCLASISRAALHAYSLEILTSSKNKMRFEAPLPADFSAALEEIGVVC